MSIFEALTESVIKGDIKTAVAETQSALDAGSNIRDIVDKGLIAAMDEMGERFSKGLIFVPQMLRSAKTMQECLKLLEQISMLEAQHQFFTSILRYSVER